MGGGGNSGGGSSSPAPSYGGGNDGGGGGYNPPAPRPTPKPRPKPKPPTPKPAPKPPAPAPEPKGPQTYLDSGEGSTSSTLSVESKVGDGVTSYIGGEGQLSSADKSMTKFIPGEGEGTKSDALETVLGDYQGKQYFGTSPFDRAGIERGAGYLGSRMAATTEVPGLDAAVEAQENAPEVGGGEVGVGSQGFGSRALIGGEGEIVTAEGAESNAVDTSNPAVQSQSDLQKAPEAVDPMPGKAAIYDYNFTLPFFKNANILAFRPGSRDAAARARGPISRGLMSARSGFGRRFF